MFRLDQKVAGVIGAGSGIGAAIAEALAQQGAMVVCLDVDADRASQTAERIGHGGGSATAREVDVRDSSAVDGALDAIVRDEGRLDVVVCTPGINIRKPLVQYTDEEFEQVMDVNLRGAFNALRGAARCMLPQRSGSILAVSSISCSAVEPGQVVYAGTKAAIAQMVRVLAAEVGPLGIRVNALSPGPVETPLTAPIRQDADWSAAYADKVAVGRWARPEEMAAPAVFLLSDEASYVNGEVLYAHGGWTDVSRRFQGGELTDGSAEANAEDSGRWICPIQSVLGTYDERRRTST